MNIILGNSFFLNYCCWGLLEEGNNEEEVVEALNKRFTGQNHGLRGFYNDFVSVKEVTSFMCGPLRFGSVGWFAPCVYHCPRGRKPFYPMRSSLDTMFTLATLSFVYYHC